MKKKLTSSAICVLLFCSPAFSQLPAWAWAIGANSNGNVNNNCVTTDNSGNVIGAGSFNTFSMTLGPFTLINFTGGDAFYVAKLDASGNVLWAKGAYVGSARGTGVAVDEENNVLVTGYYNTPYVVFDTDTLVPSATYNMFIVKYDSTGHVLWARNASCQGLSWGTSVAADINNNVFVTGFYSDSTITFGNVTLPAAGIGCMFIVKYDALGNALWANRSTGSNQDGGTSAATDANGNVYVTGSFNDTSITFGSTTLMNVSLGNLNDIFIVKFSPQGIPLWARSGNGSHDDGGNGIATDNNGNVIVTGYFYSPTLTFGSTVLIKWSGQNAFLVKYDPAGTLLWAENGTSYDTWGTGVATDDAGNIIASGHFKGTIAFGSTVLPSSGDYDIYVAKFDPSGSAMWIQNAVGTGPDFCNSVASDGGSNIYVTGVFYSQVLTFGNTSLTNPVFTVGDAQTYIARLEELPTGIQEVENNSNSLLYPNPSKGKFFIKDSSITLVEIYNVNGQKIFSSSCDEYSCISEIEISDPSKGIYLVKMSDCHKVFTEKIVVQ